MNAFDWRMATHEEKRAEAQLHDSDFEFGEPLDMGQGYSVAFHSATCRYCASASKSKIIPINTLQFLNGRGNMGGNEAI